MRREGGLVAWLCASRDGCPAFPPRSPFRAPYLPSPPTHPPTRPSYVKAGKTGAVELSIQGNDVGREITWNVEVSGGYDVDFFIRLVDTQSGEVTFPREAGRLKGKANGSFTPKGEGSLRLELGNTFSWLRGKTVEYDVDFGSGGVGAVAAAAAAAASS